MIKYILSSKQEQPDYKFLVQRLGHIEDYWLYNNFDDAYNKMKSLAINDEDAYILEPYFCTKDREWRTKRTFFTIGGETKYLGNVGDIMLHFKFYTDAGEWKNP